MRGSCNARIKAATGDRVATSARVNCCALMTDAFAAAVSDILGEDAVTDAAGVGILERLRHTPHGRFIDLKGAS